MVPKLLTDTRETSCLMSLRSQKAMQSLRSPARNLDGKKRIVYFRNMLQVLWSVVDEGGFQPAAFCLLDLCLKWSL